MVTWLALLSNHYAASSTLVEAFTHDTYMHLRNHKNENERKLILILLDPATYKSPSNHIINIDLGEFHRAQKETKNMGVIAGVES